MSPELDTYAITKKVKEVLTDNNLGKKLKHYIYHFLFRCTWLFPSPPIGCIIKELNHFSEMTISVPLSVS